jgi:hypothetical protein
MVPYSSATVRTMPRLCELPSCSRFADVAYGFDAASRLIWFDQYDESVSDTAAGRLCRRHAESLIPPRGWVLENRRAVDGTLFEPIPIAKPSRPEAQKPVVIEPIQEALSLELPFGDDLTKPVEVAVEQPPTDSEPETKPEPATKPEAAPLWKPSFDTSDEVGGLLNAKTPLLSRAFTAGVKEKR